MAKNHFNTLVKSLEEGQLKNDLKLCTQTKLIPTDFSIGHRGARLKFPEHTKESYIAASRLGAGMIECDVTFTKDKELVCRHSQCDLHTTTNILTIPELANNCSQPFSPAEFDTVGKLLKKASAKCCTSDITLNQFKSLTGKVESKNVKATNIKDYIKIDYRLYPDLYQETGILLSHLESIKLFQSLGVKMIPEIKEAKVQMPFDDTFTQEKYVQKIVDEYKSLHVSGNNVFIQSKNLDDVLYIITNEKDFADQVIYSDQSIYSYPSTGKLELLEDNKMEDLTTMGVKYLAAPIWTLLTLDENNNMISSKYANLATDVGLNIIAWTLETPYAVKNIEDGGGWYYQTISSAIRGKGDFLNVLKALDKEVKVKGVFSDWAADTTYYKNCQPPL